MTPSIVRFFFKKNISTVFNNFSVKKSSILGVPFKNGEQYVFISKIAHHSHFGDLIKVLHILWMNSAIFILPG